MAIAAYVHIPFCKQRCAYCDFVSTTGKDAAPYFEALAHEIAQKGANTLDTIYFGGGTPSCVDSGYIVQALQLVRTHNKVQDDAEISIECNPESVTAAKLADYKAAGINRISLGIQSLSNSELANAGRLHTAEQALDAARLVHISGFDNVSCDIMLGLKGQTVQSLQRTLHQIVDSNLFCHISAYTLTVEQGTRLQKSGYSVDEDFLATLYDCAYDILSHAKYARYEVSNFARAGKQCAHNLHYWRNQNYVGLGLAAHGKQAGTRYCNTQNMQQYLAKNYEHMRTALSVQEQIQDSIMLGLRLEKGLDLHALKADFGYDLWARKGDTIHALCAQGLLQIEGNFLRIMPEFCLRQNGIILQLI